jgi:2'-5' RNA ligase
MPFTVQLDLDPVAEILLGRLAEALTGIDGLVTVRQLGDVHHISLAIYDDPPLERFVPALTAFAETLSPFEVRLVNIGLFADATNVVFLGVVVTDSLLALHRRAHAALGAFQDTCWAYYLPGAWVPHVSVALDATDAAAQAAVATLLAQWTPMTVGAGGIRLVGFRPRHAQAHIQVDSEAHTRVHTVYQHAWQSA